MATNTNGAHRYWRIYFVLAPLPIAIAEIQLRTSSGGADVTGSGTASALSDDGVNVAANAFDNNGATSWISAATPGNPWIQYDFGAGNDKNIVEFTIESHSVAGDDPIGLELMYSDDGTTWYSAYSVTSSTGWARNEVRTFTLDASGAYRYWRVHCLVNNGSSFLVAAEIEMRLSSGGADECSGGTPIYRSQAAGNPATLAFDDDTATFWATNGLSTMPWWIGYDFGAAVTKDIVEMPYTCRSTTGAGAPQLVGIQYSSDNNKWTSKWSDNRSGGGGWLPGETRTFTYPTTSVVRPVVFVVT